MIVPSAVIPTWTDDRIGRVRLTMTEAEAMRLANTLAVLRPYSGQGLEELEGAIEDALQLLRQ